MTTTKLHEQDIELLIRATPKTIFLVITPEYRHAIRDAGALLGKEPLTLVWAPEMLTSSYEDRKKSLINAGYGPIIGTMEWEEAYAASRR